MKFLKKVLGSQGPIEAEGDELEEAERLWDEGLVRKVEGEGVWVRIQREKEGIDMGIGCRFGEDEGRDE